MKYCKIAFLNKSKLPTLKVAVTTILLVTSVNVFATGNLIQKGSFENYSDSHLPVITGSPVQKISAYDAYQFTPIVSDEDKDTLTFSILNQPPWAIFDTTTGMLSGEPTPSDIGEYTDIKITVDDGIATTELASFSIEVTKAIDIAQSFGKASQPPREGYYYYGSPELAIDGDNNTGSMPY